MSEIENCLDTNPLAMSEEVSVKTVLVKDVEDVKSGAYKGQEECISEIHEVSKPKTVDLRRYSTGAISTRASKPQVQSRYRGNHQVSSIHDICKHGKRFDQDCAVKPWKMVRRKTIESSETVQVVTSSLRRKSLGSRQTPGTKPESSVAAKRDVLVMKTKPCSSVNSESSSFKEDSEMARSVDGSSNHKAWKNKEKASVLRNEKSNSAIKKVSRISHGESSKVCSPKNLKNKDKAKIQTSSEDVKEKIVCVVESSVKGVQREKHPSSEKKTMRNEHKLVTTPKRTEHIPGKISTGLTKKKENGSADHEANPKPEKKIRPKRTGVKVPLAKQLSFKRGKVLETKPKDSSPTCIKFKRRYVHEHKTQTEGRKKNLKDKRLGLETKNDSCESSKLEKVVLRHRKVEGKKKMMTLFNNVIEETINKFTTVRKNKVEALIGAFETVISLQDTKTSQKFQSKTTTSVSKVSPLVSRQ